MELAIIVAAAENNVIGRDNALIWHLSADLKRFKQLTTGHTVIMGRRTFESLGKALPNRRNIVISRNPGFAPERCEVARSMEEALGMVQDEGTVFIIGGGMIYREMWNRADRLYLTVVHTMAEGDVTIPEINSSDWCLVERQDMKAGEHDDFDYSFMDFVRNKGL